MADIKKTLSSDLTRLRKAKSYEEFGAGYFRNVPDLAGYIYRFKCSDEPKILLIVDTSNSAYSKDYYKNKGYHFLVYKAPSLEQFLDKFFKFSSDIIEIVNTILDKAQENADIIAGGVPHGYKVSEDGEIVVDSREAILVRKIYKLYTQYGSIRKIATELKTNFSHIRDVLHDYRYEKMKQPIIPSSVLKKVRDMMDKNRKNRTS